MLPTTSKRAGSYRRQIAGHRAFVPADLPPEPPLRIDETMQLRLSEADQALGRLDGISDSVPDPDWFVYMYVRREAVLSSQIEGTQASLVDLLQFERERAQARLPHDVQEVSNHVGAMNYGLKRLRDLPVSLRLIREIHEQLLSGVRGTERTPGEFRTSQNWIGPPGCTLAEATYVPPPVDVMTDALGRFETFLHSEHLPLLLRVGLAHAQFETIHPFLDGNGRIGRLLITFLLVENGALKRPLLYLSHFLKTHRDAYYDHLQKVRDEGAWEDWLLFFLRGVREVATEATGTARALLDLRERHRELLVAELGRRAGSGLVLLENLYTNPLVNVTDVAALVDLSFVRANALVAEFVRLGLLREITGRRRDRLFRYDEYLDLFAAGGG